MPPRHPQLPSPPPDPARFLRAFGERLRAERARRGMSRKLLATHAGMSERYITQIESGKGNVSLLILRQLAAALGLPMSRLLAGDEPAGAPSRFHHLLERLTPTELQEAEEWLSVRFDPGDATRRQRVALVGLRGAGKTTLGSALAAATGVPFIELDRLIERRSGAAIGTILELYGQAAYRRYEREALTELLSHEKQFVVATGGSIVSEPDTYELLLHHCFTIWIRTSPDEHMSRVLAQGDRRPIAASSEAMDDLRRILAERTPLYARADAELDTSGATEKSSLSRLRRLLARPAATSPRPRRRPTRVSE